MELERAYSDLTVKWTLLLEENNQLKEEYPAESTPEAYDLQFQLEEMQAKLNHMSVDRNALAEEMIVLQKERDNFRAKTHELETSLTRSENRSGVLKEEIERLNEVGRAQYFIHYAESQSATRPF